VGCSGNPWRRQRRRGPLRGRGSIASSSPGESTTLRPRTMSWQAPASCNGRFCPSRSRRMRASGSLPRTRPAGTPAATTTTCCRSPDRFALVVIDVSGHSARAAIVMAMIRAVSTSPCGMADPVCVAAPTATSNSLGHVHVRDNDNRVLDARRGCFACRAPKTYRRSSSATRTSPKCRSPTRHFCCGRIADPPMEEITSSRRSRVFYTDSVTDRCGPNDSRFDLVADELVRPQQRPGYADNARGLIGSWTRSPARQSPTTTDGAAVEITVGAAVDRLRPSRTRLPIAHNHSRPCTDSVRSSPAISASTTQVAPASAVRRMSDRPRPAWKPESIRVDPRTARR
jgi:hypothetical protein